MGNPSQTAFTNLLLTPTTSWAEESLEVKHGQFNSHNTTNALPTQYRQYPTQPTNTGWFMAPMYWLLYRKLLACLITNRCRKSLELNKLQYTRDKSPTLNTVVSCRASLQGNICWQLAVACRWQCLAKRYQGKFRRTGVLGRY